jgi:hypothetical protein
MELNLQNLKQTIFKNVSKTKKNESKDFVFCGIGILKMVASSHVASGLKRTRKRSV